MTRRCLCEKTEVPLLRILQREGLTKNPRSILEALRPYAELQFDNLFCQVTTTIACNCQLNPLTIV